MASRCSLLLLLLLAAPVAALDPAHTPHQYGRTTWDSTDGLPQNTILSLYQSRNGYLWLGTQGGLARFDGIRFELYDTRNSAIGHNDVIGITEDAGGTLWIATFGAGLKVFRNGSIMEPESDLHLSDLTIRSLLIDSKGILWAGTRGHGLNKIENGKNTVLNTQNGLASDTIYSLGEDPSGTIWIGTDKGISLYKNGKFQTISTKDGLPHNTVRCFFFDPNGDVWFGTHGGLGRYREGSIQVYRTTEGLAHDYVRTIVQDRDKNLWVGTDGGLSRLRGDRFESFSGPDLLSHDSVYTLIEDREGSLWIGTDGGGINQYRDVNFRNLDFGHEGRDDTAFSVFQNRAGMLLVGTRRSGLMEHNGTSARSITTKDGLLSNTVFALAEDHAGALWIGTRGFGVNIFQNQVFRSITTKDGLSNDTVRALLEDSEQNQWIGTSNGLNKYHNGVITTYSTEQGLSHNFVYCLMEDKEKRLWIGTWRGITILENGKFRILDSSKGLTEDNVWCLYEDGAGSVWIGTYGSGLFRYRDGKLAHMTMKDGLFDDGILGILEDDQGYMWFSCYRGIFRVKKADLENAASGKDTQFSSESFSVSDGMKSTECVGGVQPSAFKDRSGLLHFPTGKGLTTIDPRKIRRNPVLPPVLIEKLIYDRTKAVSGLLDTASVTFPPGDGNLEIQYTALSFLNPVGIQFQYKMEGFDREWIQAGARRTAYYTKMPPGDYTFRVRARNSEGASNQTGNTFAIAIRPHYYQAWWFYVVLGVTGILIGIALHRLRVHRMQNRFSAVLEERNRISREIHDTLTQDFTGVVLQLEAAEISLPDHPEAVRDCLDRAKDLARTGLVESRRFVKALRPADLQSADLSAAIAHAAARALRNSNAESELQVTGKKRALSSAIEDNLLRIAQEAITNSVKHAGANRITIKLHYARFRVELDIRDNGKGFAPDKPVPSSEGGFGLMGMRERAAAIHADFRIESSGVAGTRIFVRAPTYRGLRV